MRVKDRQTNIQPTDRKTKNWTDKHILRRRDRKLDRRTNRQTDIHTYIHTDGQTPQADRQICRQKVQKDIKICNPVWSKNSHKSCYYIHFL